MKISFIGLGIMGSRMAANLLDAGYELTVYNRTKSKAEHLLAKGAVWGESAASTVKKADVLITMLSTPEVLKKQALSEYGILANLHENALWIDCSTVDPDTSILIAGECKARNISFLDAPVAGSLKPAQNGELTFLVGGEKALLDKVRSLLEVMGKKIIHAGDNGMGSALKMVVNSLLGNAVAVFSECVNLGRALGLDDTVMLEQLPQLPVVAPIVNVKLDNFKNRKYGTEFPLKWMHKDLHLAAVCAYDKNIAAPALNAVKELFAQAKQKGLGDSDMSAVFEIISSKEK